MVRLPALRVLALLAAAAPAWAAAQSFSHKDWEVACDNTRTCRAAGYQADGDEGAVSVLLTRAAGPGTRIAGQVRLGDIDPPAPQPASVRVTVAGKSVGTVTLDGDGLGALNDAQVAALLSAVRGSGAIVFSAGRVQWKLSGDGASAVLLKMDEVQGRVGTVGAALRKGPAPEAGVLPPVAAPVLRIPPLPATRKEDAALAAKVLAEVPEPEDCEKLDRKGEATVSRLDGSHVLVSTRCWLAAYNAGDAFWVANDKPPFAPKLVTASGTDYDGAGTISASHKGRGIGDCWGFESWAWDGRAFVHASEGSTGMCKLVTPGGPWQLPTLVTEVRAPAGAATKEGKRK